MLKQQNRALSTPKMNNSNAFDFSAKGSGSLSADTNSSPKLAYSRYNTSKASQTKTRNKEPKSRKGESINHLLNFSYVSPQQSQQSVKVKKKPVHYQPYDKEKFVNAKPENDYSVHLVDPDVVFEWDDIVQVLEMSSKPPTCPICLSPPSAAKITKCGHIFCHPCILQYLHLERTNTATKWRECPICLEMISDRDLKSVTVLNTTQDVDLSDGKEKILEFKLMKREPNSTVVLPKDVHDHWHRTGARHPPTSENPDAFLFSKFMTSSPQYILSEILNVEKSQLEVVRLEREDEERVVFEMAGIKTDSGIAYVDMALVDVKARINVELQRAESFVKENLSKSGSPPKKSFSTPENDRVATGSSHEFSYFFHQAIDGQQIYLHPLDIKILKFEFGEYYNFPNKLVVKLLSVRESTVTEDLRKRCKYLSHLPISCHVVICEVDLEGVVSANTLAAFERELNERKIAIQKREKEAKKDKNSRRKLAFELFDYESTTPSVPIDLNNEIEFPEFSRNSTPPKETASNIKPSAVSPKPSLSFARVAGEVSHSSPWVSSANRVGGVGAKEEHAEDDYLAWTLDLEDSLDMDSSVLTGKCAKGKKKKKNVLVVSNGGARGRS
ncbi:RING finger protein 10 [Nowakowskiella sp. JEL0407]|nr:RING finger protein 10 [Nowakowskiella sp. JEL0407]